MNTTILLVSGSAASSPIKKATLDSVATSSRAVHSVGLRMIGSPGACPDHSNKKMRQTAVIGMKYYRSTITMLFTSNSTVWLHISITISCSFVGHSSYAMDNYTTVPTGTSSMVLTKKVMNSILFHI